MIEHIIKLIWNQKKKHLAIMLEHMLVFAILMICLVSLFEAAAKYRSPGLLDCKHTIYAGYMVHDGFTEQNLTQIGSTMDNIIERLKKRSYVEAISESIQFLPYVRPSENFWSDSLSLSSGTKIYAHIKATDAAAEDVFRPQLEQGRWFEDGERPNGKYPAVVTAQFVKKAGLEAPIGKEVNIGPLAYQIVGVIPGLKESVFEESLESVIVPISSWSKIAFYREYAARVLPGYEDEFYSDYFKEFAHMGALSQYVEPILSSLSKWQIDTMTKTVSEISFTTIPTLFLLLFAFFGTMGLNLIDTKNRTKEFALRIALGATRRAVIQLVIFQNIFISLIAAIPGLVLAILVYEFNLLVLIAIVSTLVIILLFAVLSALYPALTISKMNPALSLKYE